MKMFEFDKIKNLTLNIKSELEDILELSSVSNCAVSELTYKRLETNVLNLKNHISALELSYNSNKHDLSLIHYEKINKLNNVNSRISRKKLKKELDLIENNNLLKELFIVKEESFINYKSLKKVNDLLFEELSINKNMLDKYVLTLIQVAKKRNKGFNNLNKDIQEILLNELTTVKEVAEYIAERKKDLLIVKKVEELKFIDYKEVGKTIYDKSKDKSKVIYSNIKSSILKEREEIPDNKDNLEILKEVSVKEGHPKIIVDVLNTSLIYLRENCNSNVYLRENNTVLDILIGDYKLRKKIVDGSVQFKIVKFLEDSYIAVYDSETPGKWLNPKYSCSNSNETADMMKKDFLFKAYDFIDNI